MSSDTQLDAALKSARAGMAPVIKDIRGRKDYSKTPELQTSVATLNSFDQKLSDAAALKSVPDSTKTSLKTEAEAVSSSVLAKLIDQNTEMSGMGQLNTKRTIEPSVAKAHNAAMVTEQGFLSALVSQLQVMPTPPAEDTVLTKLAVTGAETSSSGGYYQFFSETQTVRILAVAEPDTAEAWKQIQWQGGQEPSSKALNQRSVSLATLTAVGTPQKITATVNGKSLSVEIAVVPDILGFDVSDAISDGDSKWSMEEGGKKPITVRAVVNPATAAAYKFLKWQGGETDPKNPDDRRLVSAQAFKDPSQPLPVNVEINLS